MSDVPLIDVRHVTKRFPGVVALKDVSLSVRRGEFHSICGENGAGKSTLMKILSGVIPEYDGEIAIRGIPVRFAGTRDAEAAGVSIIHQELNLVEDLSAAANIFLGREKRRLRVLLDDRAMEREAAELFRQLDCQIDAARPGRTLRGGDQQLGEVAKALSREAGILIMDEPTSRSPSRSRAVVPRHRTAAAAGSRSLHLPQDGRDLSASPTASPFSATACW